MKMCIACGMPMTQISHYAKFDLTKNYCKHCAHQDGTMVTFDEKLESTAKRFANEHNMAYNEAKAFAKVMLRKMPAWKQFK
ncbi:zinc ribbon domain-containing protein [Orbaceae bacterium ac157xtp]